MREAKRNKPCGAFICCFANLLPDYVWMGGVCTEAGVCINLHLSTRMDIVVLYCVIVCFYAGVLVCTLCFLWVCSLCVHNFYLSLKLVQWCVFVIVISPSRVSGHSRIEHRQVWHIRNLVLTRISRPQNNEYPSVTNSKTQREREWERIYPFQQISDFPF